MAFDEEAVSRDLTEKVNTLLAENDPNSVSVSDFLGARFDAGLAWVHFPEGHGGLGVPQSFQRQVNAQLEAAGAPGPATGKNGIGLGMAAPTIAAFGTEEQKQKFLRPLWTAETVYCQLFSEPGAGSDLAAVATRAVRDGDDWIVNGQKVWTSGAQNAQLAILVARTDPSRSKHAGLSYFICDMTDPGVDVRPLRQITGEAEFNEVFLTDVRIPDANRLGAEGQGWKVATTTLNNERVAIGSGAPREGGMIGKVAQAWRDEPELRNPAMHDELMRLWTESEVARLTGERLRQQLAAGQPGPEGSGMKLAFAGLAQQISGFDLELHGEAGLRYDDWALRRPDSVDFTGREPGYRYLRAKGNSIEAERRRSCATSSQNAYSGCRPSIASTRTSPGRTYLDERRSAVLRDRTRSASQRQTTAERAGGRETVVTAYDDVSADFTGLWKSLASELGLAGLLVPEELGGAGASTREAAVVMEEIGRAVAPVPFFTSAVLATTALLKAGETEVLGQLAAGDSTAALVVPLSTAPGTFTPTVKVTASGLVGSVTTVAGVAESDVLVVPVAGESGLELHTVRIADATVTPVLSLDMTRRLADVEFSGSSSVRVDSGNAAQAVEEALLCGSALLASEQFAVAQWCLETTLAYVKERKQFGRAIGSYQAIKHRLADLWLEVSSSGAAARYAADTYARGDADAAIAATVAQAFCSGVAVHAAEECVQLHGGIGMTWEYPAHLYLKRAKSDQLSLGTAYQHRARLAELVDLPISS